jgi:peptidoglycan/xylan/chitin deacetylase (PgdA/CDA1 family)
MKKIHFTFDDGPHAKNTPIALEVLNKHNIKASFFLLGEKIKSNRDIVSSIVAGGHSIGNHSFNHPDMTKLSDVKIREQLQTTHSLLSEFKQPDYIFRPPYGAANNKVRSISQEMGYKVIMWNIDTEDWKRKPDAWIDFGLSQIKKKDNCLVLMHDIHSTTVTNLDKFIEKIKNSGDVAFVDLESVI